MKQIDDEDKNDDDIDDNDDHNMNRSRGIFISASFFVIVMTKIMMTQIPMTILMTMIMIKMTGGAPEVRSNKSLTLLTFDILYLTFHI